MADHPFFLEFPVWESDAFWVTALRATRASRELELLLNVLLNGFTRSPRFGHRWVMTQTGIGQPFRSEYLQEAYIHDSPTAQADFSNSADVPEVLVRDADEYYSLRGQSAAQTELTVSSVFSLLIDRFDNSSLTDRDRFLRACFWLQHAQRTSRDSVSAAHVALVTAVEALAPQAKDGKRCQSCDRPFATDGFLRAVERYIPGDKDDGASRKPLYAVRSAIAHGRAILYGDTQEFGFTPSGNKESTQRLVLWMLVRTLMRNFLLDDSDA